MLGDFNSHTTESGYQAHLVMKRVFAIRHAHAVFLPKSVQTIAKRRSVVGGTEVERARVSSRTLTIEMS